MADTAKLETSPYKRGGTADSLEPTISNTAPSYRDVEDIHPAEQQFATLYERKCALVNREIDAMGMGRYQWCIWALCGFGYFLDLLWAQAFGLVLGPTMQEFGYGNGQSGQIGTAFSAGLTAGAAFWGILVDIIGRQWAFNLTTLCACIFGLALGGSNSFNTFLVLTAFTGLGIGGNIPIDATITLESIPQNKRWLLPFLSIFQPMGVVVTSGIAYGFIPSYSCSPNFSQPNPLKSCNLVSGQPCCSKSDNWGWRYLMFTLGGFTLGVFILRFVVFRFQESPKFLIYRGHDDKAIEVLQKISKFNHRECTLTLAELEALTTEQDSTDSAAPILGGGAKQLKATWTERIKLELDRYKLLFSSFAMVRLTSLVWLTYICDYWGFTLAGNYLPLILARKNSTLDVSLKETYRSYVYIYLPGIVGVLLGTLMYRIPRVGRKWTMVISSGLMGASIFIYTSVNSYGSNIGLNLLEYFFQSMFNAVLYGWTPEAYAAPIRGTACGIASFWGRLFGIIAPIVGQKVYNDPSAGINNVLYLAGGVTLGCVLFTALLPSKMVGSESM